MHRIGTLLANSYHDDDLRYAAEMRRLKARPKAATSSNSDAKPSVRARIASALRPVPTRPADV